LVEDVKDLDVYYEKFRKRQIFNANDDLRKQSLSLKLSNFAESDFFVRYGFHNNIKAIRLFADTIGNVYKDQLNSLLNGKRLAINLIGGYFPLPEDSIIHEIGKHHNILKPKTI
jgi:hypothetical protein